MIHKPSWYSRILSSPLRVAMISAGALGFVALVARPASAAATTAGSPGPAMPGKVATGVWVRSAALSTPKQTAEQIAEIGFTSANLMINDFAKFRSPSPFSTYNTTKIETLCKALGDRGVAVDLTTWVMPHEPFIAGMAAKLPALLERCGARRLWLDAEEPWNQAKQPLEYTTAAELIREAIPAEFPMVLSAIGFAKSSAQPLARICDFWSPQAYSTTNPGSANPSTIVADSMKVWSERFGRPRRGWIMGLAAYAQPQPASSRMSLPMAQVMAAGVGEVCFWSSASLGRRDVSSFITSISRPRRS